VRNQRLLWCHWPLLDRLLQGDCCACLVQILWQTRKLKVGAHALFGVRVQAPILSSHMRVLLVLVLNDMTICIHACVFLRVFCLLAYRGHPGWRCTLLPCTLSRSRVYMCVCVYACVYVVCAKGIADMYERITAVRMCSFMSVFMCVCAQATYERITRAQTITFTLCIYMCIQQYRY
jgi:hypothetical protein